MKNSYYIKDDVAYIEIVSKGQIFLATVDEADLDKIQVGDKTWWLCGGYARTHDGIWMHSLVLKGNIMRHRPGIKPDHIDRYKLNNCRSNLRLTQHNAKNTGLRKDNKTGLKGVQFYKATGKYRARIMIDGIDKSLGHFDCKYEAGRAYTRACLKYHNGIGVQRIPIKLK